MTIVMPNYSRWEGQTFRVVHVRRGPSGPRALCALVADPTVRRVFAVDALTIWGAG